MSKILGLKKRIKSIGNIGRITNTLYKVSLSYVSYWESVIDNTKQFYERFLSLIAPVKDEVFDQLNELLRKQSKSKLLIVFGPRQGLCGALIPKLKENIMQLAQSNNFDIVVSVNSRLEQTVAPLGKEIQIFDTGIVSSVQDLQGFLQSITSFLRERNIYKFTVIYPFYLGNLDFAIKTVEVNIGAHAVTSLESTSNNLQKTNQEPYPVLDISYEDMAELLLAYQLNIDLLVFAIHLLTSENIARMVAMKNATDNTKDMLERLKLEYNRQRQANITNELLDITNAKRALEK